MVDIFDRINPGQRRETPVAAAVSQPKQDIFERINPQEKPGLIVRGVKKFVGSFVETVASIRTKSEAGKMMTDAAVLNERITTAEEAGLIPKGAKLGEYFSLPEEVRNQLAGGETIDDSIKRIEQRRVAETAGWKTTRVPEGETFAEKAVDVGAGLAAFIGKIALTKKALGVPETSFAGSAMSWELVNLADDGPPGAGLAMRLVLGATGKIPAISKAAKSGKLAVEMSIFGGLAAAHGGDTEDVLISAFIPLVFQGMASTRGRINDAQMVKSWRKQLPFMRDVATKDSMKMARAMRAVYEIRDPRNSTAKKEILIRQWEKRFGTDVDSFLKASDIAFKASGAAEKPFDKPTAKLTGEVEPEAIVKKGVKVPIKAAEVQKPKGQEIGSRMLDKPSIAKKAPEAKKMNTKKALALGHSYPEIMGWEEDARLDFQEAAVGKRSMKDMSLEEKRFVVEALEGEMKKRGLIVEQVKPPVEELVSTLDRTQKVTADDPIKSMNRKGIYKTKSILESKTFGFVHGLQRMERFLEGLDGHEKGPHYESIWLPVKNADSMATERANTGVQEFIAKLGEQGIDTAIWLGKVDAIPNTDIELTASQRIGVYVLSQNKNGLRNLVTGMGLSLENIESVKNFMSPEETQTAEWLLEQYENQWPIIQRAAAEAGIDLETLKKEYRYAPLIRLDADLETQADFLSELASSFINDSFKPEQGFLKKRKKAAGKIEIDGLIQYMHNIARVERFIQMAPVASKVGRILNNKDFKEALNDRTFNQGSKLLGKWMKDSVRGTSNQVTTELGKMISVMRRNGIVYAIGYNIPSALRQPLSFSNAVSVDPLMLKYTPVNIAKVVTPSGYKEMQDFVYSRSSLVRTRSYDRDLRRKWNRSSLKKKLRGKSPWSQKAVSWIRWMDRHTVVVAWKSLHDVGMEKTNNEAKAVEYADKWISRTQPMANAVDLPDFFRGGQLEKLITVFQNQINNNGNFYMYDILQAKRKQKISSRVAAYRIMFSYVLPAILFGMIGRGGLPKEWKQVAIDLITYPLAPIVLFGRWMDRIIRGWGQSGSVAGIAPEEFVKTGQAVIRAITKEGDVTSKDIQNIIKHGAATIGGATGAPTAQMIRTTEGIIDIAAGTTDDPRRLIYSKWALEQGKPKKKKGIKFSRKR